MPARFDLIITAHHPSLTAEFRLCDEHGAQRAFRQTDFQTITASKLQRLFDLRNYLRLYVEEGKEAAAIAETGVCIAEEVLGREIFLHLWKAENQRTLRIQLPGATDEENHLAAALARVPWEIARPGADQPTLGERNLLVRVVHDMQASASQPVELAPDEALRVLFVFAEARGSHPLGARQERRELLRMLEQEVYPQRRVVAHFLTHGVTRERLEDQIRQHNGYHVVHWSGHGHLNLLELAKPGGASDHLSGRQLLELFTRAGGFLPRLVVLSACHSGDILPMKDWDDFLAVAQGNERGTKHAGTKHADTKNLDLKKQPGFTGTAHALLQGGVPSVVAMRYAVGDDYARELAVEFYRALLAHTQPKNVAAALTLARQAMLDPEKHDPSRFAACDHATPVLYGAEQPGLTLAGGRSPNLNPRDPRLHRIAELTTAGHEHFVGRTWELAGLGAEFIGSSTGAEVKPVAVITGLGGMGKTALVAEALASWETRFEWVLLYQAKPNALGFEAFLRDVHLKLVGGLKLYHDHVRANPADAIYRDASAEFTGQERLDRLTRNLVCALKDEPILLVLDNFETNLKPDRAEVGSTSPSPALPGTLSPAAGERAGERGQPAWPCLDPAWDECLASLAKELIGSPSRVLITSRRPLAALADGAAHSVQLGPLPPEEAALYLQAHPVLSKMVFDADAKERLLAQRLLEASRFHPLLLDRLARLAADVKLREQLLQGLDTLEKTKDFAQLPALFATCPGDVQELAYLEDALATSLDQLIRAASPDARRVLWLIAVANEPVEVRLLTSVWSGKSHLEEQVREMKRKLSLLPHWPPQLQAALSAMPAEVRALLNRPASEAPVQPRIAPLLRYLVVVGLATEGGEGPGTANRYFGCHEVVRERISAWMAGNPGDQGERTANSIRLAYADRLQATMEAVRNRDLTAALRAGAQAMAYFVQAGAYDRLADFSLPVTTIRDRGFLEGLIPSLRLAVESASEGPAQWRCQGLLADALRMVGRPADSIPFYERSADQARALASAGGPKARDAFDDLASTTNNWANALRELGDSEGARERLQESLSASRKAGRTAVELLGTELHLLRLEMVGVGAARAVAHVEQQLELLAHWMQQHLRGYTVPEAPTREKLVRVIFAAMELAFEGRAALQNWPEALRHLDCLAKVHCSLNRPMQSQAKFHINRAEVLRALDRRAEAEAELVKYLEAPDDEPYMVASAYAALANLLNERGDVPHSIHQARRALAAANVSPQPLVRAQAHGVLGDALARVQNSRSRSESAQHCLAAFAYLVISGLKAHLAGVLQICSTQFRTALAARAEPAIPRVSELLADPAFAPLEQWLRQRQVNIEELQSAVDQFLDQARQLAAQP